MRVVSKSHYALELSATEMARLRREIKSFVHAERKHELGGFEWKHFPELDHLTDAILGTDEEDITRSRVVIS